MVRSAQNDDVSPQLPGIPAERGFVPPASFFDTAAVRAIVMTPHVRASSWQRPAIPEAGACRRLNC